MVQNAAEGKEDIRGVTVERGCSHAELLIVGNSNKLVYLNSQITALRSIKLHYIFYCSLTDKTHVLTHVHPEFPETSQHYEQHCCKVSNIPDGFRSRLNNFQ